MSHDHAHHHHHSSTGKRIGVAFFLNLAFALLEIVGGVWTNSIAVLADALHDLGDSLALGFTWRFAKVSERKGDAQYTFGYRRFSLLGALIMAIVLFAGGIAVLFQAIPRILQPEAANARGMILLAVIGIVINGVAALRMHGGHSVSERVVTWHFIEDVLGWIAVLIAAIVMRYTGIKILDPILSILITLYVLWNVGKNLKETLVILFQGTPAGLTVSQIEDAMREVDGVLDVHHTHVWTQDGLQHVVTSHVTSDPLCTIAESTAIRVAIKERLLDFGVRHATIEIEPTHSCDCGTSSKDCYDV